MKPTIRSARALMGLIGLIGLSMPAAAQAPLERLTADHIRAVSPVRLSLNNQPALELYYLHIRGAEAPAISALTTSSILEAHDSYKLIFLPLVSCYVYIFQVHSTHQLLQVFPTNHVSDGELRWENPVQREQRYDIPGRRQVFDLGNPPLLQDVYVLISATPQDQLLQYYDQMYAAGQQQDTLAEESYRAALVSILQSFDGQPHVSHVRPKMFDAWIEHEAIASPVTVREVVDWLSYNAPNDAPSFTFKGIRGRGDAGRRSDAATLFDLFRPGTATLTPDAVAILDAYGNALKQHPVSLEIAAHAHELVSEAENLRLSRQQAQRIQQYLQRHFALKPSHLTAAGYGDTRPIVAAPPGTRSSTNNRVEFIRR